MDPRDTVTQFTAQVERFVTSPHVNDPEAVHRFLAAVAPRGDERALDVACGPGLLVKAFAPHGREIVGVDLTPAMLKKAATIEREAGIANAQFEVADALRLPFEPNALDLVLTRLALHHLPDPRAAVGEMARVLRPGGRLGVFDMTPRRSRRNPPTTPASSACVTRATLARCRSPSSRR